LAEKIADQNVTQYISRCKTNIALGARMTATEYVGLVDELAAAIATGRLKPGDRLLPQRVFAYEKGIAASTAGRVYAELRRRQAQSVASRAMDASTSSSIFRRLRLNSCWLPGLCRGSSVSTP
jgi:hypothetical protein